MLRRTVLTFIVLFALSVVVVAVISFSPTCVSEAGQQDTATYKHPQDQNSNSQRIFAATGCGTKILRQWFIDNLNEISTVITALATVAIGVFTYTLYRATTEQGRLTQQSIDLTKQSIDLAHAEFIASHRPQLKIYFCRILPFDSNRSPDAQPLKVKFQIINIGNSEGTITRSAVQLAYLYPTDLPYLPDLPRNNIIEPDIRLYGGMSVTFTAIGDKLSGSMHSGILGRVGKILYLVGWIAYRDGRDNERTAYFCRQYMPELERFTPFDDLDCEQTH
jgi:hypothetical protein